MVISPTSPAIRHPGKVVPGRRSTPGATYFITLCEGHRRPSLLRQPLADEIKRSLDDLHGSGDFTLIAAAIMPIHVHLLGVLGPRLPLGRLVGKFKASTHRVLRPLGFEWEGPFHEHPLRDSEDLEPFARHIFLSPYRANLFSLTARWPLWWRWGDAPFAFESAIAQAGSVPRAWLDEPAPAGVSAP